MDDTTQESRDVDAWGEAFWDVFGAFGEDFDLGDRDCVKVREVLVVSEDLRSPDEPSR